MCFVQKAASISHAPNEGGQARHRSAHARSRGHPQGLRGQTIPPDPHRSLRSHRDPARARRPSGAASALSRSQEIDARPSDCIALALRANAPIYVSDKIVLEESVYDKKAEEEEMQRFKKYIESLKPSDFKES